MPKHKWIVILTAAFLLAGGLVALKLTRPPRSHEVFANERHLERHLEHPDGRYSGPPVYVSQPHGPSVNPPHIAPSISSPGLSNYDAYPPSSQYGAPTFHEYAPSTSPAWDNENKYPVPPLATAQATLTQPAPPARSNSPRLVVTTSDIPTTHPGYEDQCTPPELNHEVDSLPEGYVDITFRVVSTLEEPGDSVDILYYGKLPGRGKTAKVVLNNVRVMAVAQDVAGSSTPADIPQHAQQPTEVCTFRVKDDQLAILGIAFQMGELFLARQRNPHAGDEPTLGSFAEYVGHDAETGTWSNSPAAEPIHLPQRNIGVAVEDADRIRHPEPDAKHEIREQLRISTQELERIANHAEETSDFALADRIRELAHEVRLEARNLVPPQTEPLSQQDLQEPEPAEEAEAESEQETREE